MAAVISRKTSLAGAAALLFPRIAGAQTLTTLQIGVNSNESNADAFYAKDAGIFAKNGLDVDINVLTGGAAVGAAVTGGTLQVGAANLLTLVTAIARGLPFVAIAPAAISEEAHPASGIVVAADSPIHGAKDLDGKIVSGISIGGLDQLAAYAWIDKNGGDSSTIKYIELPPPSVPTALEQGRIAAGLVPEPLLSAELEKGGLRLLGHGYDGIAPRFQTVVWFAKRDWANANAATVRAFATSLTQGQAWANANPQLAIASLSKWTKSNVDRLRTAVSTTLDPALMQPLIDSAYKYKMLPRRVTPAEVIWTGR